MRKQITSAFTFIVAIAMSISCQDKGAEYSINGKLPIDGYDGRTIYLCIKDSTKTEFINIDSTTILNNTFSFHGKLKNKNDMAITYIFIGDKTNRINMSRNTIILGPSEITASIDNNYKLYATGTPLNEEFSSYMDAIDELNIEERAVYDSIHKEIENKKIPFPYKEGMDSLLLKQLSKIIKEKDELTYNFLKEKTDTPVYIDLLTTYSHYLSQDKYLNLISDSVTNMHLQTIHEKADKKRRVKNEERAYIKLGDQFAEMICKDVNNKEVKLSQFVNNSEYTLIYFWSGGCPGSFTNMPFLSEAYEAYKDKGFNIVGICDGVSNEKGWREILDECKLQWPQVLPMPNEKDAMAIYGVEYTPFSILVDKTGKIVEKDINSSELKDRFGEYHHLLQMQEINPATQLSLNP